jgi:hypothetical protein
MCDPNQDIETRRHQKIRSGVGMVLEQAKRGEITSAISVRRCCQPTPLLH